MSLVGFKANNHGQQVRRRGADDQVDDRGTTAELFGYCSDRWGPFDLDVAAAEHNAKCDHWFSIDDDGLAQSWSGARVWCNPPYSDIRPWVEKALERDHVTATLLLPANRTEQAWWQDLIEPIRDMGLGVTTSFLRNRHRFIKAGATEVKPNERPPFGNVVVHFIGREA